MNDDLKTVLALSTLAVVLVVIGLIAVLVNPWVGTVLGVVFAGVAAVIRAIRGSSRDDGGGPAAPGNASSSNP